MALALHPVFTILIALVPAAFSMWWGRAVLRHLDDPAFPERLLAYQRRTAPVAGVSAGLLIVTAPERIAWTLPLLILARMLAAYPIRKVVHNETWSLRAYLSFFLRLIVTVFGFWLFVAALPSVAALAGTRDWIVASALGAIAAVWNLRYATVFRAVLHTKPVDAPAICSRFAQLTKDCGLPEVKLDQVDLRGGAFANAVALPSIHAPAVVVTDTLMARLGENEVVAILAHELAHLEHYNRRRLMQGTIAAWVLIGAGVLLSPVIRLAAPGMPGFVFLVWPVVIIAGLLLSLQHRQKHETESDLRAVGLTGDPEALVRALTKLHAFARIPRRWEAEFERHATHPSLARRIQAIRRASGTAPESITEPATFIGAETGASVTFRDDRLEWHEGASMTHAIHYQSLRELRIDVRSSPAPRLVAVDSAARRWTIPLQTGDIARAQAILDVIDVHLGKADDAALTLMPLSGIRLLILLLMVAGMAVGQMSVFFTGLLAIVQPVSQVAAAAGVSALAASGLAWRDRALWQMGDFSVWLPATLALCGAALLAVAFANRRDPTRAGTKLLAVLAVSVSLAWMTVGLSGVSAIDLHRNVREWPAVTVLTLACAGALAFVRPRRARWASLPVTLLGVFAGYAGSTSFVDRFVTDPFVAPAPTIAVSTSSTSPLAEFSVDFQPSRLWLSPAGRYVALSTEDAHEQSTIHAGRAGGSLAAFSAEEAMFLTESRLLLLERQPQASVLRLLELADDHREVWSLSVPVVRWAHLSIDRSSERWRLLGRNADDEIISAEGQLGTKANQQWRWKSPPGTHNLEALAVSRGNVIALETRHDYSATQSMRLLPLMPFLWALRRAESRLWNLSERAAVMFRKSNAELTCHSSAAIDQPSTCAAFDGTRTRFFAVDAKMQRLTAHASLDGRMYVSDMGDRDWLTGWWDQRPIVLHAATREAIQLPAHLDERPYHVAIGSSVIAGIFPEGNTSTVRIYPLTH